MFFFNWLKFEIEIFSRLCIDIFIIAIDFSFLINKYIVICKISNYLHSNSQKKNWKLIFLFYCKKAFNNVIIFSLIFFIVFFVIIISISKLFICFAICFIISKFCTINEIVCEITKSIKFLIIFFNNFIICVFEFLNDFFLLKFFAYSFTFHVDWFIIDYFFVRFFEFEIDIEMFVISFESKRKIRIRKN